MKDLEKEKQEEKEEKRRFYLSLSKIKELVSDYQSIN